MKIVILSTKSSLYSTQSLKQAALRRGHEVAVLNHTKCLLVIESGRPAIFYEGKMIKNVDAIIPRIGASVAMFGTAVVRQFEMQKVLTTATAYAIEIARNKLLSQQLFSMNNIGIPKTAFAKFPKKNDIANLTQHIGGVPLVIKLLQGTQGLGVVLAETKSAAKSVIEAFSSLKTNLLVQEFIQEANRSDIRAIVVGDRVVAAMKRQGSEGEFRSNLHQGGKAEKVQLSGEEQMIAIKAAQTVGLSVAGVDLLPSNRGLLVMEVNSSPGLEGIEQVTGINVAEAIIEYLETQFDLDNKNKIENFNALKC